MHEHSLVKCLFNQVRETIHLEQAGGLKMSEISEVRVELGPLSGVEPILLKSAFNKIRKGNGAETAVLKIEEVPLTAFCSKCQASVELSNFIFRCSKCNNGLKVTGGDGVYLVGISYSEKSPQEYSAGPSPSDLTGIESGEQVEK